MTDFYQSFARPRQRPSHAEPKTAASRRAFDAPATGQELEAFHRAGPLDALDGPCARARQCTAQFLSCIAAISEHMTQPREAIANALQLMGRPFAVLNIGSMGEDEDREASGIGEDMALAALHFLVRIITRHTATFRNYYALAVNHANTGRVFAPFNLSQVHHQHHGKRVEQPAVPSGVKTPAHRRNRRKPLGQQASGTSRKSIVEQRVDKLEYVRRPWVTATPCRWNERLQYRPLRVCHVDGYRNSTRLRSRRAMPVHAMFYSRFSQ